MAHPSQTKTNDVPPFLQSSTSTPTSTPSDDRLQALYASTSIQRSTNPTGYAANVSWWSTVLQDTLRSGWINGDHGDRLVLRVDDAMVGRLEDGRGGRPRGIGGVVETLSTTAPPTLHPLPHFLSSPTPLHASPSLASRFIARPLWWAVSQLNPFGSSAETVEKEEVLWNRYGRGREYVHIPLLEAAATAFKAHIDKNPILSYTDSLYDLDLFAETFAEACFPTIITHLSTSAAGKAKNREKGRDRLSKRDLEVLVRWLARDCGLVVTDGSVIKLLDVDQVAADHPISEADRGAVSVLNALRKVEKQVTGIEEQIEQAQQKAKRHLSLNQKSIALSYLRSKKQLEDLLAKRVGSAEQLRGVVRSIDQAKGDVEILQAYETSTSTLSTVLSHPSLSPDRIAQTTDALAEAMANQAEIDEAVRVGGEVAMGTKREEVDEDELARELEEMVKDEKAQAQAEAEAEAAQRRVAESAKAEETKVPAPAQARTEQSTPVQAKDQDASINSDSIPKSDPKATEPALGNVKQQEQKQDGAQQAWQRRYDQAQLRQEEEKRRAEQERLERDARRKRERVVVAE